MFPNLDINSLWKSVVNPEIENDLEFAISPQKRVFPKKKTIKFKVKCDQGLYNNNNNDYNDDLNILGIGCYKFYCIFIQINSNTRLIGVKFWIFVSGAEEE